MHMERVYFNLHTALFDWQDGPFPLLVLAACIAAGIWYLRADWALATRGRRWQSQRTVSFFSGLITVEDVYKRQVYESPGDGESGGA